MLTCLALLAQPQFGLTQENPGGELPSVPGGEKLVITADDALEWHRGDNYFLARGNAEAVQGEMRMEAQSLKALYIDGQDRNFDLKEIIASESVVVRTPEAAAYGEKAEYDIAGGVAVMTGQNLRMVSEDYVVTARDVFEYHVAEGKLFARGNAKATSEDNVLNADILSATFEERDGERTLQTIEAEDNIVITTPTETVYGDKGIYQSKTNTADLYGNVRIERGPNVLEGARAQVNLTTNVSRILGGGEDGTGENRRVRGTFYPDALQEDE